MRIQFFLAMLFFLNNTALYSQTTIYKKIAQRSDQSVAGVWKGIDSFRWTRNSNAFLTHQIRLKADASNNWSNDFQYTFTLNGDDTTIEQVRENWNGSAWINVNRYTYDYNTNNELVDIFYQTWNGSTWANAGRISFSGHNTKHYPNQKLQFNWSGGTWVNNSRLLYDYYPNDSSVMSEESYLWDNISSSWDSLERKYYTYVLDSVGTITTSVPHMGLWFNKTKEVNSYVSSPLLKTSYFYKEWDTTLTIPAWVDKRKTAFTYTPFDSITKIEKDVHTVFGWQNDSRTTILYNANNRLSESYYETNTGGWNYISRFTRSYVANKLNEEIQYVGLGSTWEETKKLSYVYDALDLNTYRQIDTFNGASYFQNRRDFYYYSPFVVGTQTLREVEDNSCLYPNPASTMLYLKVYSIDAIQATIQVLDAAGKIRKVILQPIYQGENNIPFDISSLSKGNYFLRVINEQENVQKTHRFQVR